MLVWSCYRFIAFHPPPGFLEKHSTGCADNQLGKLYSKEDAPSQIVFTALTAGFVTVFDVVIEREDGRNTQREKAREYYFYIPDTEWLLLF